MVVKNCSLGALNILASLGSLLIIKKYQFVKEEERQCKIDHLYHAIIFFGVRKLVLEAKGRHTDL